MLKKLFTSYLLSYFIFTHSFGRHPFIDRSVLRPISLGWAIYNEEEGHKAPVRHDLIPSSFKKLAQYITPRRIGILDLTGIKVTPSGLQDFFKEMRNINIKEIIFNADDIGDVASAILMKGLRNTNLKALFFSKSKLSLIQGGSKSVIAKKIVKTLVRGSQKTRLEALRLNKLSGKGVAAILYNLPNTPITNLRLSIQSNFIAHEADKPDVDKDKMDRLFSSTRFYRFRPDLLEISGGEESHYNFATLFKNLNKTRLKDIKLSHIIPAHSEKELAQSLPIHLDALRLDLAAFQGSFFTFLQNLENSTIKHIELKKILFNSESVKKLTSSILKNCETLTLIHPQGELHAFLQNLKKFNAEPNSKLRHLKIEGGQYFTQSKPAEKIIQSLPKNLQTLHLKNNNFIDEKLKVLVKNLDLKDLRKINLSRDGITIETVKDFATYLAGSKEIKEVILGSQAIHSKELKGFLKSTYPPIDWVLNNKQHPPEGSPQDIFVGIPSISFNTVHVVNNRGKAIEIPTLK